MGTLLSGIEFTGSLGSLTAYKMRGTDKIVLRMKGGASIGVRYEMVTGSGSIDQVKYAGAAKAVMLL